MTDYIDEVFGESGLFAAHFPGYEQREGQVALAPMVDEAMRDGRHAALRPWLGGYEENWSGRTGAGGASRWREAVVE